MTTPRKPYSTLLQQAKKNVPGFASAYAKFHERVTIDQNSKSMIVNYSRSLAAIALHFNRPPQEVSVDEINSYLYRMTVHEKQSRSYFKQAVYGLRHWFRLFGMKDKAIQMPSIKKDGTLPTVLSREECRLIFKAPRSMKHRFMLAFAYAAGLRMNELRLMRISDVDIDRRQVHVRLGKGRKDRYVILSEFLANKLPQYLIEVKPKTYLFEGQTPAQPMGERSIQFVIAEALKRTEIKKEVSMHTLRHSFATHLLEDGVDIYSIQRLLGHSDIRTTIVYLHVAEVKPRMAHSPLDTLYGIKH
ncbi:MAG TPA: tyrosine-type recombinase/integrase [Flavitalea sp.]|nr:tyrosine-type recombinase/integrase [Flavitalea sp.]